MNFNFIEVFSQINNIPGRCQAIIWTNDVYWHIYASLSLNELEVCSLCQFHLFIYLFIIYSSINQFIYSFIYLFIYLLNLLKMAKMPLAQNMFYERKINSGHWARVFGTDWVWSKFCYLNSNTMQYLVITDYVKCGLVLKVHLHQKHRF